MGAISVKKRGVYAKRTRQIFKGFDGFIVLIILMAFGGIIGLSVYLAVKKS